MLIWKYNTYTKRDIISDDALLNSSDSMSIFDESFIAIKEGTPVELEIIPNYGNFFKVLVYTNSKNRQPNYIFEHMDKQKYSIFFADTQLKEKIEVDQSSFVWIGITLKRLSKSI